MNELRPVEKETVSDIIENVLDAVVDMPYKDGALIMFHFLNGMLVGNSIDMKAPVKRKVIIESRDSVIEEMLKQNSRPQSGPRQEGGSM